MRLLDLFCGCGGISFGFELAGFTISGGIDNDKDSIETFENNFKKSKVACKDLLEYSKNEIISTFGNQNITTLILPIFYKRNKTF